MKISSIWSRVVPNGLKDRWTYRSDVAVCRLSQFYGSAYNLCHKFCVRFDNYNYVGLHHSLFGSGTGHIAFSIFPYKLK